MKLGLERKKLTTLFFAGLLAMGVSINLSYGKSVPTAYTVNGVNFSAGTNGALDGFKLNHNGMAKMNCWIWQTGMGYAIKASNSNGQIQLSYHNNYSQNQRREDYDSLYIARQSMQRLKAAQICDAKSNEKVYNNQVLDDERQKQEDQKYKDEEDRANANERRAAAKQAAQEKAARDAENSERDALPKKW